MDPSTSQNDMTTFKTRDDVLTLLVHLGYLGYEERKEETFIPNQEIAQEFMRAVKVGGCAGDILLIGINYNTETKVHDCMIEKTRK